MYIKVNHLHKKTLQILIMISRINVCGADF